MTPCKQSHRYPSAEAAVQTARDASPWGKPSKLLPVKCDECQGWHLRWDRSRRAK